MQQSDRHDAYAAEKDGHGLHSPAEKVQAHCDFLGVEILSYEGMDYDIGLPVDPLNLEDFEEGQELFIETMLEPVIKKQGTSEVIRNGKAILGSR